MRVYLFKRGNSKYWQMKWTGRDGREYRQSTRKKRKSEARDVAAQKSQVLENEIEIERIGIDAFCERYEREFLAGKSREHINKLHNSFGKLVDSQNPILVTDITSSMVAEFADQMRKDEISEATIRGYLGYIDRSLKWAVTAGIITQNPLITRPKIPDDDCAKGRPLTLEEIERLEMQAEAVVGENAKNSFCRLLKGLRLSGLRLGEAMRLWWPGGDVKKITIEIGANVLLSIPARSQKKRKRQIYPVVPEFAEFLLETPAYERTGPVFCPLNKSGKRFDRVDTVSKRISDMGKKAGIVVKHNDDTGDVMYASAQDLRRTFGLKWSKLVPAAKLQKLMRHANIETTLKFYAIEDANSEAQWLQENFGTRQGTETEEPQPETKSSK